MIHRLFANGLFIAVGSLNGLMLVQGEAAGREGWPAADRPSQEAPSPKAAEETKIKKKAKLPLAKNSKEVKARLETDVDFDGLNDPKATLGEFLDLVKDQYGLTCEVDEKAFLEDNVKDALQSSIAERPFPKLKGLPLQYLLRKVTERIGLQSGSAFYIQKDRVILTTGNSVPAGHKKDLKPSYDYRTRMFKADVALWAKLKGKVDFPGLDDPKATLGEFLDEWSSKYDLFFEVNESAFLFENIKDIRGANIAEKPIPMMKDVPLMEVLDAALKVLGVSSRTTYYVEDKVIHITTTEFRKLRKGMEPIDP